MTELTQIDSYGALIGHDTLRIQRLLPGPKPMPPVLPRFYENPHGYPFR